MPLGEILNNYTYLFGLILVRYVGLFLITPVLGSRAIPTRVKVGLAFLLTLITLPVLQQKLAVEMPSDLVVLVLNLVQELTVGFIIGFIVFIVFASVQLAGQFVDLRMGFMMANVVDPMYGTSAPLVGQFKNILATLVFLAINGHHFLIRALYKSFNIIHPAQAVIGNQGWQVLIRKAGDIFIIAFQIALPVVGTVFIIDIILGFLARTIPQMNIFIVGFPFKILMGFLVFMLSIHVIVHFYDDLFQGMFRDILKMIKLMAGDT